MGDHPGDRLLLELQRARKDGRALAAVNVYDAVQAMAVADAARAEQTPVILQTASSSLARLGESPLASTVLAVRATADWLLGVHLDHSHNLAQIERCLGAGYDSVMIDGSHLPFEENIAITRAAVNVARRYGAWVEAELGCVDGEEDRTVESPDRGVLAMTSPAAAAEFVERTGVDLLAVAVGNVHGIPKRPLTLSLDRLAEIRDVTDVPLVLHGASGLPDEEIQAAVALGVAKINTNTEVRRSYLEALRTSLTGNSTDDLITHFEAARSATSYVVKQKIRLLANSKPDLRSEALQ